MAWVVLVVARAVSACTGLVPRVIENEQGGPVSCPLGDSVADEPVAVSGVTYECPACPGEAASAKAGLAPARPASAVSRVRGGCIMHGRLFFLHFKSRRKRRHKGHGASPCYTIRNRSNVSLDWRSSHWIRDRGASVQWSRAVRIALRRRTVAGGACWHSCTPPGRYSSDLQRRPPAPRFRADGFRADTLADQTVILEIKAVPALLPVHETQLQSYLRMSGLPVGLLLDFRALRLKDGLRRFA
jgi:PD-(D/E)XK nuclease superfamily